ncbi:MAG: LLM class flavin-dependent oxidoreductase [Solirubrobacterales bacterium]|nr:LLM class flavin-dependent oxidoreductase [Solirubrobacterales bacterium]
MDLCVMIEGQEDVSWEQWVAIARVCEANDIPTLFRSDHYLSVFPSEGRQSLDAWGTICGLAAITSKLRLGTMVSPTSFRPPSVLAKLIATADQISGGRIEPGIGAGWHQAEHEAFGFPFLSTAERMEVLEEQLEIMTGLWSEGEFEFHGRHYDLAPVDARPKPVQNPMPLIMGGNAGPKGAALAARFASEYNTPNPSLDEARQRRSAIEAAWLEAGRDPAGVRFSVMTGAALGRDEAEAEDRLRRAREKSGIGDALDYEFKGSPERVVEQLTEWREAGVDRVMLQLLLHDDLEQIELIGRIAPALA